MQLVAARPSRRHRDVCRRGYLRFGDGHPRPSPNRKSLVAGMGTGYMVDRSLLVC